MSERKRKKHDYADRLKYMRMLEAGKSFNSIRMEYGVNSDHLKVLWSKYQKYGPEALKEKAKNEFSFEIKKDIVLDIEENHLTLCDASLKYGSCPQRISAWLKLYREEGLAALARIKKRGRPRGMGRPRKSSKPLTELERLQKENQELKTEIALLKKVRALVEEKKAHLRKIGQKPSTN